MKQAIRYSTYASVVTIVVLLALAATVVYGLLHFEPTATFYIATVCILVFVNIAIWYAPMSISIDDSTLSVNRSLRIKDIPLSDITSVRLCPPTMAARRICGCNGLMGYWGWFSEPDLGRYFAYYGRASDCFLVTLRDGRRYMLGCINAPDMVAAIRNRIKAV